MDWTDVDRHEQKTGRGDTGEADAPRAKCQNCAPNPRRDFFACRVFFFLMPDAKLSPVSLLHPRRDPKNFTRRVFFFASDGASCIRPMARPRPTNDAFHVRPSARRTYKKFSTTPTPSSKKKNPRDGMDGCGRVACPRRDFYVRPRTRAPTHVMSRRQKFFCKHTTSTWVSDENFLSPARRAPDGKNSRRASRRT